MITQQSLPISEDIIGQKEALRVSAQPGPRFPAFDLLGIRIHAITMHDLIAIISDAIENDAKYVVTNLNMHLLYGLHRYSAIRDHHARADFTHVDGLPLIPLLRLVGIRLKHEHRIAYVEFLPGLAAEAASKNGWRIYYLGSEPGVAEKGAALLRERNPGLKLRTHHGYFETRGSENEAVLADIRAYAPDILMVGMGMPRQETWVNENLDRIVARTIFSCCGCTMDYIAGKTPACPRWLANNGFEWLYRLLAEPARLWHRYLVEPWFVLVRFGSAYLKLGRKFSDLDPVLEDTNE
ncbi:MAG TPA: WecB/TagA/CpsF family glycosyltransferase [Terriglobia bacterium]|nr:WecB/TagA/CpsF family glycosyltransferase [Terriglobia bacterium]